METPTRAEDGLFHQGGLAYWSKKQPYTAAEAKLGRTAWEMMNRVTAQKSREAAKQEEAQNTSLMKAPSPGQPPIDSAQNRVRSIWLQMILGVLIVMCFHAMVQASIKPCAWPARVHCQSSLIPCKLETRSSIVSFQTTVDA